MSFSPYLYFSFVFVSIFSILEITKNFKHSVLLKIQFIGLLTFASIVNLFLFKGRLSELELSIVRLLIDIMPMFVLNIALILYAYKIPTWVFIGEGITAVLGSVLVYMYATTNTTYFLHTDAFQFYAVASTSNFYLKIFRKLLLATYSIFFCGFIVKTSFFEHQKKSILYAS